MAKLFEEFVEKWLSENLSESLKVDPQFHVRLDANADLSFKIDLVLRDSVSEQALAVIDVKYKLAEQPSEDDIQQVVAYAVELGVSRAHLVYPFCLLRPVEAKIGHVKVSTIGIDLSRPFSETWNELAPSIAREV
jgi:5-methylcytosine-specific restriction endonuclease McrBC regulatory subunit McrC